MAAVTAGGDGKGVWSEPRWQGLLRVKVMGSLCSLPSMAPPCGSFPQLQVFLALLTRRLS